MSRARDMEEAGPASAKKAVIDHVRAAIGDGTLKPGQKIRERELVEQCRVSRSAVREALVALISEDTLTQRPGRSPVVRQLTRDEALAQQQVLEAMEGLAAGLAAMRHDQAQFVGRLNGIRAALSQAVEARDIHAYMRADEDFHAIIVEMSGNPLIKAYIAQSGRHYLRQRAPEVMDVERLAVVNDEHHVMLDAIMRGDPAAAEAAMRSHVRAARVTIMKLPDILFRQDHRAPEDPSRSAI